MPGHRNNTKTLHQAAKSHELRLTAEEARQYSWSQVTDKPTTFAPAAHSHAVSDITNLQATLDGKAASSHTHTIANVSGLQTALDTKPTLVGGKLPTSYLNRVEIGETLTAASQTAMLALDANVGDIAVRSDNDSIWMLKKEGASTLANWFDITANIASGGVASVNSMVGTVVLGAADVGAVPTARSMTAGTGLVGGGDLSANRTVTLSSASQASLLKADSAVQGNGLSLWTGTASQYAAIATKSSTTVYVVTA